MKRILFATSAIALLTGAFVAPATYAETAQSTTTLSAPDMSAFDLVSMAYRGDFRDQGVPGYDTLGFAQRSGRIGAKDVVQAAIRSNRLSEATMSDRAFLNAVDANLRSLDSR